MDDLREKSILIVGEDNPISEEPEHALYSRPDGCSGHRLMKILGLDEATYLALGRTNLCVGGWNLKAARERASQILAEGHNVVVALGTKVIDAFHYASGSETKWLPMRSYTFVSGWDSGEPGPCGICEDCEAMRECGAPVTTAVTAATMSTIVCIPHPSGRNRAWNAPQAVGEALALLKDAAPWVPWGHG